MNERFGMQHAGIEHEHLKRWHPEDNGSPSQPTGVQGRNSYAIKIRTQQQKQEQFAFSEFEVESQLTGEPQRQHTQFELPVKVRPQQIRWRIQQVQNDIKIEPFSDIRKEQPEDGFAWYDVQRICGKQTAG